MCDAFSQKQASGVGTWEPLHISAPITVKTMSCFEDSWLWRGYNFWSATLFIGTFFLPSSQLLPTPKRLGMPRGLTLHLTRHNLCLQGACHQLQSHLPGEPCTVLVENFGPPACLQLLQKVRPSHVVKVLHRHTAESHDEQDWCSSSLWCLGVSTESLQTKKTNVTAPGDSTTSSSRAATS